MPVVFMYGPDTVQGRMFDRVGPTEVLGPAVLPGYALRFDKPNLKNKSEGFPNLHEDGAGEAFGVLFELSAAQVAQLDGFFGGYEQRSVKVQPLGETDAPVVAKTWIARRAAGGLQPSAATVSATAHGMRENDAPERFVSKLKEVEPLPSEKVELMVQFTRGFSEEDARALLALSGGRIRRRMRTDHADQVMLLLELPKERADAVQGDLKAHPQVTLVERNSGDYQAL